MRRSSRPGQGVEKRIASIRSVGRWVVLHAQALAESDRLRAIQHLRQRRAGGIADGGMKEAGADIAVGLQHRGYPRSIAARRDVRLQSVMGAEVRHDAAQIFGRFQNEAIGGIFGDQRFHLAFQFREFGRHGRLAVGGPFHAAD